MSRSAWRSLRIAAGVAFLGAVLWRTGTGPAWPLGPSVPPDSVPTRVSPLLWRTEP